MIFEREKRYIVIKIKDLEAQDIELQNQFAAWLSQTSMPNRDYVCVESDWPEYEVVWKMIKERVQNDENSKS